MQWSLKDEFNNSIFNLDIYSYTCHCVPIQCVTQSFFDCVHTLFSMHYNLPRSHFQNYNKVKTYIHLFFVMNLWKMEKNAFNKIEIEHKVVVIVLFLIRCVIKWMKKIVRVEKSKTKNSLRINASSRYV